MKVLFAIRSDTISDAYGAGTPTPSLWVHQTHNEGV